MYSTKAIERSASLIDTPAPDSFTKLLDTPVSLDTIMSQLVPPRHFANATFANFEPNPAFPSQVDAVSRIQEFIKGPQSESGFFANLRRNRMLSKKQSV